MSSNSLLIDPTMNDINDSINKTGGGCENYSSIVRDAESVLSSSSALNVKLQFPQFLAAVIGIACIFFPDRCTQEVYKSKNSHIISYSLVLHINGTVYLHIFCI